MYELGIMNKGVKWLFGVSIIYIFLFAIWHLDFSNEREPEWGVSFSQAYAEFLGLDWRGSYQEILKELRPAYVRLAADWDKVEPQEGKFDFTDLDWQVSEAKKVGAKIVMVIGARTPRWPECHNPAWLDYDRTQNTKHRTQKIEELLRAEVEHFRNESAIVMWQVENEPLLNVFGKCPAADLKFLKKEISLVRSLDSRPILVTDSGELSLWLRAGKVGDYLGTTMYRKVWNRFLGYWRYDWLIPPAWYRFRALANRVPSDRLIVSELQTEAWLPNGNAVTTPLADQLKSFSINDFAEQVKFARRVGASPVFLWGTEYWYWRNLQGDPSLMNYARQLFPRF